MAKHNQILDTVDECITNGVKKKILHLTTDDDYADGRTLMVNGNRLINFASYSYMGLETDRRLKRGGIEAIEKYGTQFGASRAYISIGLYDELEFLFEKMFSKPVLIAPSTTLAHQAAIPVLVRDEDVVILDQHVHSSVQMTVKIVKSRGVPVELLRHNDLNRLEERIKELRTKHEKIWYMLDGVYSMYGDFAPLKELYELMNKYEQFYCYIDDAHGMSWAGENGTGYVMSQIPFHKQMILLTSLNKAFASAGGAIITPDRETHRRIRTCGGTLIFSTPIQPPMLGVGIAAAKIHLSPEIVTMQEKLYSHIAYCQHLLKKHNLPVISNNSSPIFYVGTGLPRLGYNMVRKLMNEGFYMSIGLFPAVSMKCTGLRFCVNLHHEIADIEHLVETIAYHYPQVLLEEGKKENDIRKAFKMPLIREEEVASVIETDVQYLKTECTTTIEEISKDEWNSLFKGRGSFDWNGLKFLERTFKNNPEKENNWEFRYVTIRDNKNVIVAATFYTVAYCKDDMFSPAEVSEQIEVIRKADPYYMCSKVVMMGSLLTEGNHLYLNKEHPMWKKAMLQLLEEASQIQEQYKANTITLRDFEKEDNELCDFLLGEGYIKVDLPDAHVIDEPKIRWSNIEEYLTNISYKNRKNFRRDVARYEDYYDVRIVDKASDEQIDYWYKLYCSVKGKSMELNTFSLSKKFFVEALADSNWEILELSLKSEYNDRPELKPIAVVFSYKNENIMSPMILGLDYYYLFAYKNYKQTIFQILKSANRQNLKKIYLGFTASHEKRKFGAVAIPKVAYIQTNDSFNMQVLELSKTQERIKPAVNRKESMNMFQEETV